MLLCLDAGNSTIEAGCVEGDRLLCRASLSTNYRTADEFAVIINEALRMRGVYTGAFAGAVICSVVPRLTGVLREAAHLLTGTDALVVGAGIKTGLNIGLDNPGELGADLVATAVGALETRRPPLIIVDLGTATTVCVIDARSRLLGGAILPGVGLSTEALVGSASLLPDIPIEVPKRSIGTNTIDCLKSGAVFGTASAIDGMIERFEAELGESARLVATGSFATTVVPYCRHDMEIDPSLTMRGLALIWRRNRCRRR